jgi:hypothetical protein
MLSPERSSPRTGTGARAEVDAGQADHHEGTAEVGQDARSVGDTVRVSPAGGSKFPTLAGRTGTVVRSRLYGTVDVAWSGLDKPWLMYRDEVQGVPT